MLSKEQKYKLYNTLSIPDQLQEYCRMLADSDTLTAKQQKIATYILKRKKHELIDKYILNDEIITLPKKSKLFRKNFTEGKWTRTAKVRGKTRYR